MRITRDKRNGNSDRLYFLGLQNHCGPWLQPWNRKMLAPWKKSYDKPRWHIKKQRHHFADNDPYSQSYSFSSSQVQVLDLVHQESWMPENWCFWTVMLEKTLESPLDSKKIKPVHPKGNLSWIFIGRTDAEVETPILWPPDVKNRLHWKRPWCWERLKAGGEGDDRGWDGWMASRTQWTCVWASSRMVKDREAWRAAVHGVPKSRTRLSDWTTTTAIEWSYHWVTSINIFIFATKGMCKKVVIFVFLHFLSLL